jgi:hypothetical protein
LKLNLNPKIRNAAIVGALLTVVSVLNAIVNLYPDGAWTPIVAVVLTVLTGYQTSQGDWKPQ